MRNLHRFLLVLIPIACLAPLSLGLDPSAPTKGQDAKASSAKEGPTPFQEAMGQLQRGQRSLRKLVADPNTHRDALMESLTGMEAALLVCIANPPAPGDKVPADGHALWVVHAKASLTKTLSSVLDCQEATLKGDGEALSAAYNSLKQHKKDGHESFQ